MLTSSVLQAFLNDVAANERPESRCVELGHIGRMSSPNGCTCERDAWIQVPRMWSFFKEQQTSELSDPEISRRVVRAACRRYYASVSEMAKKHSEQAVESRFPLQTTFSIGYEVGIDGSVANHRATTASARH